MMLRYTATGESRNGCHEIPADIAAEFVARGGQDIQVWGEDYIIDTDTEAAALYAAEALGLENFEEAAE